MGKNKVIFYLIDGARPDILTKLADKGDLPHIKQHLIEEGSFTKGTTCFPSTTGPAYLPYLTGTFPGDHNITGIRWFDKRAFLKDGRWARNSMRSYCGYEAKYFNDDMNPKYPSLFEEYDDGINLYNMVTKGVKEENDVTKEGKTGLYFNAHFKHRHHEVDRAGHKKLMESLDRDSRFTYAVFPSIDWDAHTYHYDDPKTTHQAYKIVDESLGELVQALKRKNEYDNTLIIMASDHGLSSTHSHLDLGKFFKKHKYRVLEYPTILTLRPNMTVFISGNSFASLSFLDKKEDYTKSDLLSNHGESMNDLIQQEAIDFVVVRGAQNEYFLLNNEGESLIRANNQKLSYHPITADVLGIGEKENLNFQECFDQTLETEYPDALWQCHQLMQSPRAGDVAISAANGYDLRDFWEIPEHKGSHGSLHWEHMHVPLLTNQKNHISEPKRTTEIHPIIKNWIDQ